MDNLTRKQKVLMEHSEVINQYEILASLLRRFEIINEESLLKMTPEEIQFVEETSSA